MLRWQLVLASIGFLICLGYWLTDQELAVTFLFTSAYLLPCYFLGHLFLLPFASPDVKQEYYSLAGMISQWSRLVWFVLLFWLLCWFV